MSQPTDEQIRARLARHRLTERGMASQIAIIREGRDTLDGLDAAWDRLAETIRRDAEGWSR